MEANVQTSKMYYSESLLQAWQKGDYSMLLNSDASDYIKNILTSKAKKSPGSRFFGEAFIASNIMMQDGWYNSFKWLTKEKWLKGCALKNDLERLFYGVLMKHIGLKSLTSLQSKVMAYYHKNKEDLNLKMPVAPDLWVVDPSGYFRFIEAKLPWDSPKPHQHAGLIMIQKYLETSVPVTVTIMNLLPTNSKPAEKKLKHNNIRRKAPRILNRVIRTGNMIKGKNLRPAEGDLISKDRTVHIFYGGKICRPSIIDGTAKRGERLWKKEGECPDPKKYRTTVTGLGLDPCKDCLYRFGRE